VRLRAKISAKIGKLQAWWWNSRERMLQRAHAQVATERREHLASRHEIYKLELELEAKEATIRANSVDPLAEAKKLLRLIEEILVPLYTRSGEVNNYELRCWMDDYRQFKKGSTK
jgi:hypothetical protein